MYKNSISFQFQYLLNYVHTHIYCMGTHALHVYVYMPTSMHALWCMLSGHRSSPWSILDAQYVFEVDMLRRTRILCVCVRSATILTPPFSFIVTTAASSCASEWA